MDLNIVIRLDWNLSPINIKVFMIISLNSCFTKIFQDMSGNAEIEEL